MKKFLSPRLVIASEARQSSSLGSSGFTLLELLIVVSIIAILSVALIIVLNPAETLRKSRDSQRMSDLATMKTALGLYLTSTSTPHLGGNTTASDSNCKATLSSQTKIYYSVATVTGAPNDGSAAIASTTPTASSTLTDSTGWVPVNFDSLTGGSPISNLPIDPVNTAPATPASTDYVYRYACLQSPLSYEIDAALESIAFASSTATDGGNNANFYEVGTNLKIIGTGTTF